MVEKGLMKEVGLVLGFGIWVYLNEWREGISRKVIYKFCIKKLVFFRRGFLVYVKC